MQPSFTAVLIIFAIFTVRGTKINNTTPVDSAKTDGQTIFCDHYACEDPKTSEAIKKLDEKLEAILKLLEGGAPPISPGEKRWEINLFRHVALSRTRFDTSCCPYRLFWDEVLNEEGFYPLKSILKYTPFLP